MVSIEIIYGYALAAFSSNTPLDEEYTNSIGMQFARIEPGTFDMGFGETSLPDELAVGEPHRKNGDFDEHPTHKVKITNPFHIGVYEVTNAQYEQFDPEHRQLRGKRGFSKEDNEAVVFVSWHDAMRFCEWLSEKEGLPYRLPTEAECEYVCRAGTTTPFHTGETLPEESLKNAGATRQRDEVAAFRRGGSTQ